MDLQPRRFCDRYFANFHTIYNQLREKCAIESGYSGLFSTHFEDFNDGDVCNSLSVSGHTILFALYPSFKMHISRPATMRSIILPATSVLQGTPKMMVNNVKSWMEQVEP